MFVETKAETQVKAGWLDKYGRQHPRLFTLVLLLVTMGVTIGLLLKPSYTLVLYQGF